MPLEFRDCRIPEESLTYAVGNIDHHLTTDESEPQGDFVTLDTPSLVLTQHRYWATEIDAHAAVGCSVCTERCLGTQEEPTGQMKALG